jgi:hypothetical protein
MIERAELEAARSGVPPPRGAQLVIITSALAERIVRLLDELEDWRRAATHEMPARFRNVPPCQPEGGACPDPDRGSGRDGTGPLHTRALPR